MPADAREEAASSGKGSAEGGDLVRRSLALSLAARYASAAIQFIATTILARLLTPRDYGVYTVAFLIVNLTSVLRDFGAVSFLFQEKNLTSRSVQTVHGISLLISAIIAMIIIGASGAIAAFYRTAGLQKVLLILALTSLLTPYSSVILTLLRREMNFRALLFIETSAAMMNAVVAIGFALSFGGYMSLAWGALAAAVTMCLMASARRPRHYRLWPSLHEWRHVMSFGIVSTAGFLLNEIGIETPELVVGRLLGIEPVGILTRADGLVSAFDRFITGAVTPVAVSSFAAQHRRGEAIKANFRFATQMWTGVAWPFFAVLCLLASPVIHILFGAGWDRSIPILQLYCLAAAASALTALTWNALQATGAVSNFLAIQLVIQPVKLALVVLASFISLVAVACAMVIAAVVSLIVAYRHAHRLFETSLADVLQGSAKSAGVTACASAVPILVLMSFRMDDQHIWFPFAVGAVGACAGWFAGLYLLNHLLWPEIVAACSSARSRISFLAPGRNT